MCGKECELKKHTAKYITGCVKVTALCEHCAGHGLGCSDASIFLLGAPESHGGFGDRVADRPLSILWAALCPSRAKAAAIRQ